MAANEVLGIQAARRALAEVRAGLDDPLARDRLDRTETLLARVAANLGRRTAFDAAKGIRPDDTAAAIAWADHAIRAWEEEVANFDPRLPAGQDHDDDLTTKLQSYFAARFPDDTGLTILSVRRLPGGRSKQTLIVETSGARSLPTRLVLRTDSSRTTAQDSVAREYPLIDAVHRAGCPTPEPLWFEGDHGVIGAPFIAFAHMPGEPAGNLWGAYDKTGDAARALAVALAGLHRIPIAVAPDGRSQPARDAVATLFETYEQRWIGARPSESFVIGTAFEWLKARLDRLEGDAVIVHGDAHLSNMLMHKGHLVCLLDWEFWHFGHPAEDLAYCRPYVEQTLDWDVFLALYQASGGPVIDRSALDLFAVWRPLRNAVLAAGVAHDFQTGDDLNLETAAIALATYPRMEGQVARALAEATTTPL